MAERRQWTEEDLQALREAAEILERLGVWSVSVRGVCHQRTEITVGTRDFVRIAQLPGVTVERPNYLGPTWRVRARVGGMAVTAIMESQELPTIGWRYVGPADYLEEVEPGEWADAN